MDDLHAFAEFCREIGNNPQLAAAGTGCASLKTADKLYIMPRYMLLTEVTADCFVEVARAVLATMDGGTAGIPVAEALLHDACPYRLVLHTQSPLANGLSCAKGGSQACPQLFRQAQWVPFALPGAAAAENLTSALARKRTENEPPAKVVFLQNNGLLLGGDLVADLRHQAGAVSQRLNREYEVHGIPTTLTCAPLDGETIAAYAPQIRTLMGTGTGRAIVHSHAWFHPAATPLTLHHVTFAGGFPTVTELTETALSAFGGDTWRPPVLCDVPQHGVFVAAANLAGAVRGMHAAGDAALVEQLSHAFGGPRPLPADVVETLTNAQVAAGINAWSSRPGRLGGRVAVVTGAAQGFGLGIARGLVREGACVAIVDINYEGAHQAAVDLEREFGGGCAFALACDIADEDSVAGMAFEVARICGGLDLLIANAGVLRAGSVQELSKQDWDFVTNINYTGYFLCVKHLSKLMSAQWMGGQGGWTDIVQINSKSGLEGSNRNGAYAGSKFGGIGLTQSFAMELVDSGIKVNSICPGNFFDGPLWSDPDRGLFVQYLNSGKVPGAQTIEDVKRFYESKVPMGRGCSPEDVMKAILYCVEQQYETGQAIPVTGGQVMLN